MQVRGVANLHMQLFYRCGLYTDIYSKWIQLLTGRMRYMELKFPWKFQLKAFLLILLNPPTLSAEFKKKKFLGVGMGLS